MARRPSLPQSQGLQLDGCVGFAAVGGPPDTLLDERLAEIARLDVPALRAKWASLFGRSPPKGVGRRLLELAAAYHEQAKIHGGLKPAVRRKLLQMGRTRPNAETGSARSDRKAPLSPGSRLVREWHGRSHTVEVTAAGFQYAGRQYRSLSEVARTITGARWSGPRFFGL
jgi:hypothetical protein